MPNIKQIINFFNTNDKKKIIIIILLFLIGALFESISVGLILPIFSILIGGKDSLLNSELFIKFSPDFMIKILENNSEQTILFSSLIIITVVYFIKNFYLSGSYYLAYKIIYQFQTDISDNLFKKYLSLPYNFFLNSNIEINFGNFFIALLLSLLLSLIVKITYLKVGRALNDKDYFSDTFIPLAIITTLVITVVKFSLALSLGLVGALSIVRFRAAIKEPEELVYLFFVIAIGLANGANQFLLSIISTLIIVFFLIIRNIFKDNKNKDGNFGSDTNIISINISKDAKNIDTIIEELKNNFKYLKLKSANFDKTQHNYIFWYEIDEDKKMALLKEIPKYCDENINISIYSKSGAFE